jgi:hypothetical protein
MSFIVYSTKNESSFNIINIILNLIIQENGIYHLNNIFVKSHLDIIDDFDSGYYIEINSKKIIIFKKSVIKVPIYNYFGGSFEDITINYTNKINVEKYYEFPSNSNLNMELVDTVMGVLKQSLQVGC